MVWLGHFHTLIRIAFQYAINDFKMGLPVLRQHARGCLNFQAALDGIGCSNGVSAHILPSLLTSVLIAWAFRNDMNAAIDQAIFAGGDTDSTAAIVGGLLAMGTASPDFSRLRLWSALPDRLTDSDPSWSIQDFNRPPFARICFEHLMMVILFLPNSLMRTNARVRALMHT